MAYQLFQHLGGDEVVDEEAGFLIVQRDVNDLALKLELLINNEELRLKMGIAGREHFMANFTLEKFYKNISFILRDSTSRKF